MSAVLDHPPPALAPGFDRRDDDREPCAFCHGDGEVVNPGNGDLLVRVRDWLPPVVCPRCGGRGWESNP